MLVLAAIVAVFAQGTRNNTPLRPQTCVSPSGEWSLFVDPSERSGAGKSTMSISKLGTLQWSGEQTFTFQKSVISDAGVSAGFGYTEGRSSFDGALFVAVVDPSGKPALFEELGSRSSRGFHGSAEPNASHIALNHEQNLAIVCVPRLGSDLESEAWCLYQLYPAKKLGVVHAASEFEPAADARWTLALTEIRGTPLTLAQWCTWGKSGASGTTPGSEFAIYDESWKLVWSLLLPGDLGDTDGHLDDALSAEMMAGGGILDTSIEHRFEVRLVKQSERVSFEVARDPAAAHGWSVREVARTSFKGEPHKPDVELAHLKLPAAGAIPIDIDTRNTAGPVRNIKRFCIDALGRTTFVREEKAVGVVTLVTLGVSGRVEREIPVAAIEPQSEDTREWSALSRGEWLLTLSPWEGDGSQSRAWKVRGDTGAAQELSGFHGPAIQSVEPTADGGFVLLGIHRHGSTMSSELRSCATNGTTLWTLGENSYDKKPSTLFSPADIAVDKDGSILVLDSTRELVQVFDAKGHFLNAIDLTKSWQHATSDLTDLISEPSGSILIYDGIDPAQWRRISRSGTQLSTILPMRESKSTAVGKPSSVRIDARGRLWGHDEYQLMEYDEQGVVHERFGTAAPALRMKAAGSVYFDGTGRLALTDDRGRALCIFAPDGTRSVVCALDKSDFDSDNSIQAVSTAADGTICLRLSDYHDRYLAFPPGGKRIGPIELGGTRLAFDPRTRDRWAAGEGEDNVLRLRRYGADGKLAFETNRRPDGGFFGRVRALACAPDGSAVLLDGSGGRNDRLGVLCFYGSKGEPQRQLLLPGIAFLWEDHMQVGQRWILISGFEAKAFLVSLPDGKCAVFEVPDADKHKGRWAVGLSPDESEIWALESVPAVLHRFTLPE